MDKTQQSEHPAAAAIKVILNGYPDFDISALINKQEDSPLVRLLSTEETLRYLGRISRMTLWRLVKERKAIKPVMVGSRQNFDIRDLDRFIKSCKRGK